MLKKQSPFRTSIGYRNYHLCLILSFADGVVMFFVKSITAEKEHNTTKSLVLGIDKTKVDKQGTTITGLWYLSPRI